VAALAEAQAQALNLWDNRDELLQDIDADHVVEASRLATLLRDVSKVLGDRGMPPIPGIPWDPCMSGDVLGVVDVILEHMKEAYDSGRGPWD
jgi:hypothetical protein